MKGRIDREKITLVLMIRLYCKDHHFPENELCESCEALTGYAIDRTSACRFGKNKPVCSKCPVHCYRKEMRSAIRTVMRYSGPRMLFYHPYFAIMHMIDRRKSNQIIK